MIALTLAVATSTYKKIIEEAGRRWGVKLFHDNFRICYEPNPLAPRLKMATTYPPLLYRHGIYPLKPPSGG
jgi:hypothetical protein